MSGGGDLAGRTILDTFSEYGFEATRTALRFSRVPTFEEAETVAQVASGAMDMSKWWLGDLILASESMWGESYAQLSAITNRSPEGLANLASVAKRVSEDIRRAGLSFSHHEAVASLSRERQAYWLDFAEENRLSVHELRPYVRAEKEQAEATHDVVSQPEPPPVIEAKPVAPRRERRLVEVVREILDAPVEIDGRVCIGADVRERLRGAVEATE